MGRGQDRPLWHAKPHDLLYRPSRTASYALHPVRHVRPEPVQCSTSDTEGDLEPCQQDVMVDGIKCCGQVEQGEDREVAVIDCIQNVRQYFQHGHIGRVMCPICGLQSLQKVCRVCLSVCLSVCPSVTRRYCVNTTAYRRCSLHCRIAKCI